MEGSGLAAETDNRFVPPEGGGMEILKMDDKIIVSGGCPACAGCAYSEECERFRECEAWRAWFSARWDETRHLFDGAGRRRHDIMESFPKRLRRLRRRSGKSFRVTAELCGVSASTFLRYERGERRPTVEALYNIAEHFGVSMEDLII